MRGGDTIDVKNDSVVGVSVGEDYIRPDGFRGYIAAPPGSKGPGEW